MLARSFTKSPTLPCASAFNFASCRFFLTCAANCISPCSFSAGNACDFSPSATAWNNGSPFWPLMIVSNPAPSIPACILRLSRSSKIFLASACAFFISSACSFACFSSASSSLVLGVTTSLDIPPVPGLAWSCGSLGTFLPVKRAAKSANSTESVGKFKPSCCIYCNTRLNSSSVRP